jgi:hypothetical protein
MGGNGLSPSASGSDKKGSWALTALYEDVETELASGGANFLFMDVVDFVVDIIETQSPVVMTETINIEPSDVDVVVDTIETQIPVVMTETINIEPSDEDFVVDIIETQSPVVMTETINIEPSVECLSKKFLEELSLGTSSGSVCECLQDDSSMWELNCFDIETNDKCAIDRAACGNVPLLKCCGDRRCSNGICRLVSQGRYDRRKPLVANGNNGSLGTIRGAGGSNYNIP